MPCLDMKKDALSRGFILTSDPDFSTKPLFGSKESSGLSVPVLLKTFRIFYSSAE
jgi:hypothetical protein